MNNDIKISESEWKVLEVVWEKPGCPIGEIRDSLSDCGWSYSTIKTLVIRLTQKGALRIDNSKGNNCYYATLSEKRCKMRETKNFVDRIYNGSVKMMVAGFVGNSKLSPEEADELMSLINKMEE